MAGIRSMVAAGILGVAFATLTGCSGGMTAAEINKKIEREEAWRGQAEPGYIEFTHAGKLYVVGYPASEALVKSGKKLALTTKGFGYGPNGETVIFEENKIGLSQILIEQYESQHGKKS
jgi:hypothetical protein